MCEGLKGLIEDGKLEGSAETTRNIIRNMLKRDMSEEDIMALTECKQEMIDEVRRSMQES